MRPGRCRTGRAVPCLERPGDQEWSPAARDSRRKTCPTTRMRVVAESGRARHSLRSAPDYLSLQLTRWFGYRFIKWRAEEQDYPWQKAYPVGLVKFLAIRPGTPASWFRKPAAKNSASRALRRRRRLYARHPDEYYLRRQRVAGRLPRCMPRKWIGSGIRRERVGRHRTLRTDVVPRQELPPAAVPPSGWRLPPLNRSCGLSRDAARR